MALTKHRPRNGETVANVTTTFVSILPFSKKLHVKITIDQ